MKFELPLPPSVNKLYITKYGTNQRIKDPNVAQPYYHVAILLVKQFCREHKVVPIKKFHPVWLTWYLHDKRIDSHNLEKTLFDVLERGGLFENDKYILNRAKAVRYDKKNPRVEIEV